MLTRSKRRRLEEEAEDPVVISSRYGLEREATIKRAKTELMSLKVVDLRRELGTFGLTKSGNKTDLVDRLAHHKWLLEGGSPFDSLPDEVLLRIVRMATWKRTEITNCKSDQGLFSMYDYDFILESISLVSVRFNRIARDTSIWKDIVFIQSRNENDRILHFLNDGVKKLLFIRSRHDHRPLLEEEYHIISEIASKWPKLEIRGGRDLMASVNLKPHK